MHGAKQKPHYASGITAKRGFYKWISKMKRRLKRKRDWIAIAVLVWEIFSTMLPYIS
jgi:hypothetical protein